MNRLLPPVDEMVDALGGLDRWSHQCHAASLALVKSGIFKKARVARGSCDGVGAQHSWVVLGDDCYDDRATIVDPTLWSYDPEVEGIWIGTIGRHEPHGYAGGTTIWQWGRPADPVGDVVELTPSTPLSKEATLFLDILGPLDRRGWMTLASHAPVRDWPAGEILAAMDDTAALSAVVPIDRLGMLTDRNPGGLYLP